MDAFGTDDFSGNPLAVVAEADGLDGAGMQRIATWLNLSETTFLLPSIDPAADSVHRELRRYGDRAVARLPKAGGVEGPWGGADR